MNWKTFTVYLLRYYRIDVKYTRNSYINLQYNQTIHVYGLAKEPYLVIADRQGTQVMRHLISVIKYRIIGLIRYD